ncbi:MAG: hypothetical protein ACI8RD_009386, partial [Bacillariaceae sp.]
MSAAIEMMFDEQTILPQQQRSSSSCEKEGKQVGCNMLLLCLVEQTAEQISYEIGVDGMEDVSFREFVDLVKTTTSTLSSSSSSSSSSNTSQKDNFDIELLVEKDIIHDRSTSVLRRIYYSSLMNLTSNSNTNNTRKEDPPPTTTTTTAMKEDPPITTANDTNNNIRNTNNNLKSPTTTTATTPTSRSYNANISFLQSQQSQRGGLGLGLGSPPSSPLALSRASTADSSSTFSSWATSSMIPEQQQYIDSPQSLSSFPSPSVVNDNNNTTS